MICNAPDDHRLQLMIKTSTKSRKWKSWKSSFGSVQTILKDHLDLRRVKPRLVPKFLNFFGKEGRVQCKVMLFLTIKASTIRKIVLSWLKRSNVKRYEHWRLYLQTTFQHASKIGGNSRRYRFGRINKDCSFYNKIHLTFWSQKYISSRDHCGEIVLSRLKRSNVKR